MRRPHSHAFRAGDCPEQPVGSRDQPQRAGEDYQIRPADHDRSAAEKERRQEEPVSHEDHGEIDGRRHRAMQRGRHRRLAIDHRVYRRSQRLRFGLHRLEELEFALALRHWTRSPANRRFAGTRTCGSAWPRRPRRHPVRHGDYIRGKEAALHRSRQIGGASGGRLRHYQRRPKLGRQRALGATDRKLGVERVLGLSAAPAAAAFQLIVVRSTITASHLIRNLKLAVRVPRSVLPCRLDLSRFSSLIVFSIRVLLCHQKSSSSTCVLVFIVLWALGLPTLASAQDSPDPKNPPHASWKTSRSVMTKEPPPSVDPSTLALGEWVVVLSPFNCQPSIQVAFGWVGTIAVPTGGHTDCTQSDDPQSKLRTLHAYPAEIVFQRMMFRADDIVYNTETQDLHAEGHVYYDNFARNEKIWCEKLDYHTEKGNEHGTFYQVVGETDRKS